MARRRGRKRHTVKRQPNGQPKRYVGQVSATPELLAKRAEIGGDGQPGNQRYGSLIGCWFIQKRICLSQYEAGERLIALVTLHDRLIQIPKPPHAIDPDGIGGRSLGEDDPVRFRRVMSRMADVEAELRRMDRYGRHWHAAIAAARNETPEDEGLAFEALRELARRQGCCGRLDTCRKVA